MGRRKIEIQPLTDDRNRTVTFVKRKAGLFKKAHELAVLCQVDLAVIIVGANNKVYEFSSIDTNELIQTYQLKQCKIHESKGPENYGYYPKKRGADALIDTSSNTNANTTNTTGPGAGPSGVVDHTHDDLSDDDLVPLLPRDPKRIKLEDDVKLQALDQPVIPFRTHKDGDGASLATAAPATTTAGTTTTPSPPQRPILRVQIPTDNTPQKPPQDLAKTLTAQLANLPGQLRATTDSEKLGKMSLAPPVAKYPNYTSLRLPDLRKPPVLLPIHAKSQLLLPLDVTAPNPLPTTYYQPVVVAGMSQQLPLTILPTPLVNQAFALAIPAQYNRVLYSGGGDQQTPVGLRYAQGEMFPLPLNFYPPHDWQISTGMTPVHQQAPGGGFNHPPLQSGVNPGAPGLASQPAPPLAFPNQATISNFGRTIQAVQQRDNFPSPLQFSNYTNDKEK